MRHSMAILAALFVILAAQAAPVSAQTNAPAWRDTGAGFDADALICDDPRSPAIVLIADSRGTTQYNWRSGESALLNSRRATFCTPFGTLYAPEGNGAWRFGLDDPQGRATDHMPTAASDDPDILYAATSTNIWASEDGGLSWIERSSALSGAPMFVARLEPRTLYQYVTVDIPAADDPSRKKTNFQLYTSTDGGIAWNQLTVLETGYCHYTGFTLQPVQGAPTPHLFMQKWCSDHPGSGFGISALISADGATRFEPIGSAGGLRAVSVANTYAGLLRYMPSIPFSLSRDGGQTWQDLAQPDTIEDFGNGPLPLVVASSDFAVVALRDGMYNLWFSSDSGAQWQRANGDAPGVITFTHATPPVVVGVYQGTLRVLELPQPAGERCFAETGFCVSGRIREYWEQNGGLPVFGYPIGPQIPLAVEGRTVIGQWFERNRLELHPESAKPYDVLLGRLGADALEARGVDWRSYPQADPKSAHYFAATGQTIAPEFWKYWSSHGLEFDGRHGVSFNESLALFGMPLSPPIMETSRTDGGTYLTQYFERARFEYHPENAGTPYILLLGLLGSERHGR